MQQCRVFQMEVDMKTEKAMVLYTLNNRMEAIMKRAAFLMIFSLSPVVACDGLYLEGGLAYNPDAYGITSNILAGGSLVYRTSLTETIEVDLSASHESDAKKSGEDDLISHEAYGITFRKKLWSWQ